jgi:hypothetical protein
MQEFRPSNDSQPPVSAARCTAVQERMLLGLILIMLVRANEALAGDGTFVGNTAGTTGPVVIESSRPLTPPALKIVDPGFFAVPQPAELHVFSATEFVPRKHTVFDRDPAFGGDAPPMLRGTTVWQRLEEYRARDGVRLLTLWESRGSSVSLLASKRGDPSLQWSSRLSNHDGATRGLLDRLFSVSFAGAGNSIHSVTHAASTPAAAKPPATTVASTLK